MSDAPERRKHTVTEPSLGRLRVLIADDDADFAAYLATLTRRLGLDTVVAVDGEEAIRLFTTQPFDLLISDFEMPKRNGLEVVVELRGNPSSANTYAVMLTVHDDVALKVNALAVGYDDFLSKSCSEIEVVAKVTAARRMIARQQSLDLSARRWETLASRDELTGLWTRRFFFEEATRLIADGTQISVLLFDLDDFKKVNDRFGHIMGDTILRDVGTVLLHSTRHDDIVARYGGDELIVVATGISTAEGRFLAGRLAAKIEALQWETPEEVFSIGVSFGAGFSALIPDGNLEQILDAADRDLYAQKWLRKHPDQTDEQLYLYGNPGKEAKLEVLPSETVAELPPAAGARIEPHD